MKERAEWMGRCDSVQGLPVTAEIRPVILT